MLMMIHIAATNAGLLPRWKIIAALSTSITAADTLDYLMEPIFTVPLIGDIPDSLFCGSSLSRYKKSRLSTTINLVELLLVWVISARHIYIPVEIAGS
jgi:hypothetical protein